MAPEWKKAAEELKGKVKLGALDATVHQAMAQRYDLAWFIIEDPLTIHHTDKEYLLL